MNEEIDEDLKDESATDEQNTILKEKHNLEDELRQKEQKLHHEFNRVIGVRRGESKRVEDGCIPLALRVGHP
jgi:hypothetical protein